VDNSQASVSILIPTIGREDLAQTLDSVKRQNYPNVSVTVVYDGPPPSVASTETLVRGEGSHGPSLKKGLELCNGDLVAIVDDDTIIPPDWLAKAVPVFSDPRVAFVGGSNLTPPDSSPMEKMIGYVQSSYFGSMRMSSRYNVRAKRSDADETDLIATGIYRRNVILEAYRALGHQVFGSAWENILLTWMRKQGYLISYDPELSFYHERRDSISGLYRQVFKSGSGRARYFKLYPRQMVKKGYMLAPSLFATYLLILPLLVFATRLIILPVALYLITALGISIVFSIRSRDVRALVLLPALFLTNHLAYGLGFLSGLFGRKVRTWGSK
jgi:glycosyltransferase involved in cell wall biosynthesis